MIFMKKMQFGFYAAAMAAMLVGCSASTSNDPTNNNTNNTQTATTIAAENATTNTAAQTATPIASENATNTAAQATTLIASENANTNTVPRLGNISAEDVKGLVFFDTETTGLNSASNRIIEITMFSEEGWFDTLVNIGEPVPEFITGITGISTEMLKGKPTFAEIAPEVYKRMKGRVAVAHNAKFDMRFVKAELERAGFNVTNDTWEAICTLETERTIRKGVRKNNTLTECIKRRGIEPENAHRSEDDVRSLIELYKCQKKEGAEFVKNVY